LAHKNIPEGLDVFEDGDKRVFRAPSPVNEIPKYRVLKERNRTMCNFLFRPFRAPILFCNFTQAIVRKQRALRLGW